MAAKNDEKRDAVVIGSGFGGLGAALGLARAGLRPLLLERLGYPGGCASTFERGGVRFEAGATLFSGFGPGQLFRGFIEEGLLDLEIDAIDPVIELRAPGLRLPIGSDRERFVAGLLDRARSEDERRRLAAFLREAGGAARTLWGLIDRPEALPPFERGAWRAHLGLVPGYLRLLPLAFRPLARRLRRHGLDDHPTIRLLADAMSQITLQGSAAEVEAPAAMATLEYPFRGSAHVVGGIGRLAEAMVGAIEKLGGEVRYFQEVRRIDRAGEDWQVRTRRGAITTPKVLANVLPRSLRELMPGTELRDLDHRERALEDSWSACMHYLVLREPAGAGEAPIHLQLVADPAAPLVEGNNVFVSISGARDGMAPRGLRSVTMSTHLALRRLRTAGEEGGAALVAEVQERMIATLRALAPEWAAGIEVDHPASPRTFRRFTARPEGMVGGIPRRAGLAAYRGLLPCRPAPGLRLVGDTVFPGQSTLATTIGGLKAARDLLRRGR